MKKVNLSLAVVAALFFGSIEVNALQKLSKSKVDVDKIKSKVGSVSSLDNYDVYDDLLNSCKSLDNILAEAGKAGAGSLKCEELDAYQLFDVVKGTLVKYYDLLLREEDQDRIAAENERKRKEIEAIQKELDKIKNSVNKATVYRGFAEICDKIKAFETKGYDFGANCQISTETNCLKLGGLLNARRLAYSCVGGFDSNTFCDFFKKDVVGFLIKEDRSKNFPNTCIAKLSINDKQAWVLFNPETVNTESRLIEKIKSSNVMPLLADVVGKDGYSESNSLRCVASYVMDGINAGNCDIPEGK